MGDGPIKTEILSERAVKPKTNQPTDGEVKDQARLTFRSVSQIVLSHDDIPGQLDAYFKVCDNLQKLKADGAGWRLDDILILEQTIIKFNPLRGSCSDYTMPERLARRACLINVVGSPANSMDCFRWAVLAGLHLPPHHGCEIHWTELSQYSNTLSFEGIEDRGKRMPLTGINDFEKKNNVSINVLGYLNEPFPLHISKNKDLNTNKHVNLLFDSYSDEGAENASGSDGHYRDIQDMDRLLRREKVGTNRRLFYCFKCRNPKYSQQKLAEHERLSGELQPMNAHTVTEELIGWLFWVLRPFETIFQSISSRLQKRGRKDRWG